MSPKVLKPRKARHSQNAILKTVFARSNSTEYQTYLAHAKGRWINGTAPRLRDADPLNKPTCYFPTPPSVHSGIVPRPSMTLAILRRENREKLACVHSTVFPPPPTQSTFVFIASIGHSLLLVFILLSLLIAHVCTRDTANEISTCLFKSCAPSLFAGHTRDPQKCSQALTQCSNQIRPNPRLQGMALDQSQSPWRHRHMGS